MRARAAIAPLLLPLAAAVACGGSYVTSEPNVSPEAGAPALPPTSIVDAAPPSPPPSPPPEAGPIGCLDTASDPHNCGRCGRDCLGGTCAKGECSSVSLGVLFGVHTFLVDSTSVFLAGNGVFRVAKNGGPPEQVTDTPDVGRMASDDAALYLATPSGVFRVLKTGGPAVLLDPAPASAIAIDGSVVYACHLDGGSSIRGIDAAGVTSAVNVASGVVGCESLAATSSGVFFGGAHLGFASVGSDPVVVGAFAASRVATDGVFVFSSDPASGRLRRSTVAGAEASDVTAIDETRQVGSLSVDGTHVYWTIPGESDGKVVRVGKSGGAIEIIADNINNNTELTVALDSTAVYWRDDNTAMTMKRAK